MILVGGLPGRRRIFKDNRRPAVLAHGEAARSPPPSRWQSGDQRQTRVVLTTTRPW